MLTKSTVFFIFILTWGFSYDIIYTYVLNTQDKEKGTMRIPAECDRDADLVLSEAARRLEGKVSEKHFNKLSPAEAERLALLSEECGEVIQVVGKILRHGYESKHPSDRRDRTNRELLEKELGDVHFAYLFMDENEDIKLDNIREKSRYKNLKVGKYLHHQNTDGYKICKCGECCKCNPW